MDFTQKDDEAFDAAVRGAFAPPKNPQRLAQVWARIHARERARRRQQITAWVAVAASVLVALGLLAALPQATKAPLARGSGADAAQLLQLFRHREPDRATKAPLHDGDTFANGDGLSFALANNQATPLYALIFAVDADNHVLWLYPDDESGSAPPAPLAPHQKVSLAEGFFLRGLPAGNLRIVALASTAPVQPQDAAHMYLDGGPQALLEHPGVPVVQQVRLTVP